MAYVSAKNRELELVPVSAKFIKDGGYTGRIKGRRTIPFSEVLDEVTTRGLSGFDKTTVGLIVLHTISTMVENTLKDGNSRRLGDYFTLQMEVKGRFDEPGEQFDPEKHKFQLVLRPLSGISDRRPDRRDGLTVYNRNAGPEVKIERLCSKSAPEAKGLVFGDDFVLEGENLFMLDGCDDYLNVIYFTQLEHRFVCARYWDGKGIEVSPDGRRIVIPWKTSVGPYVVNPKFDPERNRPVAVMVGVHSHGGEAGSKRQLHRGRAFFDSWLEFYPEASVHSLIWGRA